MARALGPLGVALALGAGGCGAARPAGHSASEGVHERMELAAQRLAERPRYGGDLRSVTNGLVISGPFFADEAAGRLEIYRARIRPHGGRAFHAVIRRIGDDVYYRGGRFTAALPPGKRWSVERGAGGGSLTMKRMMLLALASTDMRDLGPDPVDGITAERYGGTADLRRLGASGSGPSRADIDVWLDRDGRPARIRADFRSREGHVRGMVRVGGYGGRRIRVPPPASVVELG